MPEYLAPGVYIEEIERGPKPIEGVATSTAAFIGETARGSIKPTLITNFGEYQRLFGGFYDPSKYMPYAVKAFFDNGGRRCYIARIVGQNSTKAVATIGDFTVRAVGPGTGGNRTMVRIRNGSTLDKDGNPLGFRIVAYHWDSLPEGEAPFDPEDDANATRKPRPSRTEDFDDLSTDPENANYFRKRINNFDGDTIVRGPSGLIEISAPDNAATPEDIRALTGGEEGDPLIADDFDREGANGNPNLHQGLQALLLDEYRDVAVVHAPGAPADVVGKVITHCENNRFRFAVIDSDSAQVSPAADDDRRKLYDSLYAAYYYPWIQISDPQTGARKLTPPGGAICGIYARSDNDRGVFKAPANETVAGALDLEFDIDQRKQETLNPRGVNVIRRFPGRGIRVWGARTISSDPLWRYVNVRRLFIFIEASIYRATQWVVFEPNDQRLWDRVKQSVTLFLRTQWREGALFGAKEEEAFSVAVGRETMTEDDILNGRLIIEVGIAPVRPAEFVIFRVYQKTQEAQG